MKINKILALAAGLVALVACSDFEEINRNPKAASAEYVKPYWALDKAIVSDQQNPNDAERVFVIYWASLGHINGDDGYGVTGGESYDDYANCLYNLTRGCITSTNTAIKIAEDALAIGGLSDHEAAIFNNTIQMSRIWRVYLMTEFVDSFGSFTTDFESTSPKYQSVEECYNFMLAELGDAVANMNNEPASTPAEEKADPAYKMDPAKWKNFGISMWMRLAMRLSEVDPGKAQAEFEKAVAAGPGIRTNDGIFRIEERDGWWDLSGVMSRTWNRLLLSNTMANLMTNFGGAKVEDILLDKGGRFYKEAPKASDIAETYGPYIKDAKEYLGIHMIDKDGNKLFEPSDSPTWGYFFDGIPSKIDPRAFAYYTLPGDYDKRIETGYCTSPRIPGELPATPYLDKKNEAMPIDVTYSWNGLVSGWAFDDTFWNNSGLGTCPKTPQEGVAYTRWHTFPPLSERYRNNAEYRVFFGPWETYFLLAEAAVRGWNAGMGAEAAYNAGIKVSFEYLNVDANYNAYINSEDYNRVGTSVKFGHTAEPANYTINYKDPVSGNLKTTQYKYPDASKVLYKGKKLNDQLTKIITQKYIANAPWLPVESWCDHRRLGLPFFEIPVSTTELNYLAGWTKTSWQNGQKVGYYPQRMKYPASLQNANPEEYQNALSLMGMTDENITTPLWWALK